MDFLPEGCVPTGCARRAAWLADCLDVRELHLHEVPQTGPAARGGEADAPPLAEPQRGLSVHPLVVDLGRDYRGGQDQALLLLQGLLTRGHAPELITLRDSLLARRAKEAGISVHGIPPGRRRLAAVLAIRQLLRGRRADVVHANEPHALSSAWLARAHRSVPLIASRRIALPLSPNPLPRAAY